MAFFHGYSDRGGDPITETPNWVSRFVEGHPFWGLVFNNKPNLGTPIPAVWVFGVHSGLQKNAVFFPVRLQLFRVFL